MFEFLKNPTGFIKCFGYIPSLPKECIVCGEEAYKKYRVNRLYDPGLGAWLMGFTFTYRKMPIFLPVCKKHFIQLMILKIIFWILLFSIFIGADFGKLIHSLVLLVFPLIAFCYFSVKSNVSIYDIKGSMAFPEIILSVRRKDYYKKLSEIEGVHPVAFPESHIRLLIKKYLLIILFFSPWIYFMDSFY